MELEKVGLMGRTSIFQTDGLLIQSGIDCLIRRDTACFVNYSVRSNFPENKDLETAVFFFDVPGCGAQRLGKRKNRKYSA